jgi:membrane associated rhomboid family serine protease
MKFMLYPGNWAWFQFISYAFLHGGWMHIIVNMFFLYLFGNNVSDRLGTARYLILYIASAVASALGHIALTRLYNPDSLFVPLLGASGAISGIIGAYLVLFPQTSITVFYWFFFFIDTIDVPALFFIALKLIFVDNIMARVPNGVAYDAHLAGYAFGIGATMALLATGLVKVSEFDLLSVIKHWNRRRKYRNLISRGFDPFAGKITVKKEESGEFDISAVDQVTYEKTQQLRREISTFISQRNLPQAAQFYQELINIDDRQIFPQQQQLDIANQLASENKHKEAAEAYEKFIKHYGNYEYIEQVKLMLGLLYSRYLNNPESAVRYLQEAKEKLSDTTQLNLCRDELNKLQT